MSVQCVSLTTDIWTDQYNTKAYLSVTAHFLKEEEQQSLVLASRPLAVDHTAANISQVFEDVLKEWNLPKEKVVCCVSDGAPNIVKAVHTVLGKRKHLHCFAHLLNLVAMEALKCHELLKSIITEVKSIVTLSKTARPATLRREQEKEVLRSQELQDDEDHIEQATTQILKFIQEVKMRWNSTYYLLKRYVTLHRQVTVVLMELDGPTPVVCDKLDIIKEVVQLMKPLEEVTNEISAGKVVTISKVIPLVRCLVSAITKSSSN